MEEPKREHEVIDISDFDNLTHHLKRKISGNLLMSSKCTIFKVPTILSRHSPDDFKPNQFSFGPFHYHHHLPILKLTEKIKFRYLLDLITRFSESTNQTPNPTNPDTVLKTLTEAITDIRSEARQYYAAPIEPITMLEFVQILVLDGCFIVELFRRKAYEELKTYDDPVFRTSSCLQQCLWHDLILLENQVPWKVLNTLFDLTITPVDKKSLVQLAIEFFGTMFTMSPPELDFEHTELKSSKHILDLLRNWLVVPSKTRHNKSLIWEDAMRSATTMLDSGIDFQPCNKSRSVLDIEFDKKKGVLEIPVLFIQETTQTVLRNLISLEQCCPNYEAVVTSYAVLFDNLINTRADMEILCKSKAITTWLNVDEATKYFDSLYIDTYVKENFYLQLVKDVNDYCQLPWHTYKRTLKTTYFYNPRTLIWVTGASIALALIFLLTVFGS